MWNNWVFKVGDNYVLLATLISSFDHYNVALLPWGLITHDPKPHGKTALKNVERPIHDNRVPLLLELLQAFPLSPPILIDNVTMLMKCVTSVLPNATVGKLNKGPVSNSSPTLCSWRLKLQEWVGVGGVGAAVTAQPTLGTWGYKLWLFEPIID